MVHVQGPMTISRIDASVVVAVVVVVNGGGVAVGSFDAGKLL